MYIDIKKLSEKAKLPQKATMYSAGLDVEFCMGDAQMVKAYTNTNDETFIIATNELTIPPKWRVMVPTALQLVVPHGFHAHVYARSSVAYKRGLVMVNSVGIIDEDYEDELKVLMMNISDVNVTLSVGERIAQVIFYPTNHVYYYENEINPGNKRVGGIGSTGI